MRIEKKYRASVQLARLCECVSRNGNIYLAGQFGGAKIAIIKSSDTDNGVPVWNLVVSDPVAERRQSPLESRTLNLKMTASRKFGSSPMRRSTPSKNIGIISAVVHLSAL